MCGEQIPFDETPKQGVEGSDCSSQMPLAQSLVGSSHIAVLFHPFSQRFQCAQGLFALLKEPFVGVQSHVDEWIVDVQDTDAPFLQFHTKERILIPILSAVFVE